MMGVGCQDLAGFRYRCGGSDFTNPNRAPTLTIHHKMAYNVTSQRLIRDREGTLSKSSWIAGPGLALLLSAAPMAAHATTTFTKEAVGDWLGTLRARDATVKIAIHIYKSPEGRYIGKLDTAEGSDTSVPLISIGSSANLLAFRTPAGAEFRGEWNASLNLWRGVWTDGASQLPLSLRPSDSGVVRF